MDINTFAEKMKIASSAIDLQRMDNEIIRTTDPNPVQINSPGAHNLIIAIEELSELTDVILLADSQNYVDFTNTGTKLHMTEELADVIMSTRYIQLACGVNNENAIMLAIAAMPSGSTFIDFKTNTGDAIRLFMCGQSLITKYLRGSKKVTSDMLTDYVEKIIAMCVNLARMYRISYDDIKKAMNIKLDRLTNNVGTYL